jgi:hypothetical protein
MSKWIAFHDDGPSPSGKTRVFLVLVKDGGGLLGEIRWYGPWRCYAFYPVFGTVFECECLRDVATFCAERTNEHRRQMLGKKTPA